MQLKEYAAKITVCCGPVLPHNLPFFEVEEDIYMKAGLMHRKNAAVKYSVVSFMWYSFSFFKLTERSKLPLCN